jgi:hypothetical protein
VVIVTKNQYILAEKIYSVLLNEEFEWSDIRVKGKNVSIKDFKHTIVVTYLPETSTSGRTERLEAVITLRHRVDAQRVYNDLISQIREQMPDQLFLDRALENILNQDDLNKIELNFDKDRQEEKKRYESATNAIRRVGKKKRRSEAVLRKAKRSNWRTS